MELPRLLVYRSLARIELPLERLHLLGRRRGDARPGRVASRARVDPWVRDGFVEQPAVSKLIPHAQKRDIEVRELDGRPDHRGVSFEPGEALVDDFTVPPEIEPARMISEAASLGQNQLDV